MNGPIQVGALVALAAWLTAAQAAAQAPVDDPTVAAAEASEVRDQYCTDASDAAITLEAEGTARVSAVWARVSRSYDAHQAVYLLYWRGLLGQCIDKLDRVQEDLEAFIAAVGDEAAYAEQVRDAERQLRRIHMQAQAQSTRPDPRPGIAVGIGLAGGAGALAGLAGWQSSELARWTSEYHSGDLLTDDYPLWEANALQAEGAANALTGAAVAAGIVGLTVAVVSAGVSADQPVTALVVPTPDGPVFALGGRW
jgi:hypothetical protein